MSNSAKVTSADDDELIGVLTAISVISKRLAKKLIEQSQSCTLKKGDKQNGKNEGIVHAHRGA